MSEPFEEQYRDVLHNIETALVDVYREEPKMTDHAALYAVETLIKVYQAELQGRTAALPQFQPFEQEAFDRVKVMSDWRLGREELVDQQENPVDLGMEPKTPEELIACLKRIKKSIEFWQKRGGRRAYFEFVTRFLP